MNQGSARPKILVITRNLPPLVGGMEKLIWHCVESFSHWAEVHVIGPTGCSAHLPSGVNATEIPISPLGRFLFAASLVTIQLSRRFKPDWIFAGSGLTAPYARLGARISRAKSAVYLHGLDVEADNAIYQALWVRSFRHFDRVLVNSAFTKSLALKAGVSDPLISILHPGVTLPDWSRRVIARCTFRQRYKLGDHPVMLFVGRITERKGLAPFVENMLPKVIEQVPDAKLVVIGDEATLSAHKLAGQLGRIQDALVNSGLQKSVLFLGERPFDDPELSDAFFASDVHVFPVQHRHRDNEGFGMVAIEAAAHGVPTVAFAVGGIPDAVLDGSSGQLIESENNDLFVQATLKYLGQNDSSKFEVKCLNHATYFAWNYVGERLQGIFTA